MGTERQSRIEEAAEKLPRPDFYVVMHFANFRGVKYMVEEDSTGERCGGLFIPLLKNGIEPRRRLRWRLVIGAVQDRYLEENTHHACIYISGWQFYKLGECGYLNTKLPTLGFVLKDPSLLKYPPYLLNNGSDVGFKQALMDRKERPKNTASEAAKENGTPQDNTHIQEFQKRMREKLLNKKQ